MSDDNIQLSVKAVEMSAYERQVWGALSKHWLRRNNRRGLPNWAETALERTGAATRQVASRSAEFVPEIVMEPIRQAGDAIADKAARPALSAAAAMLELVNDWAMELNNPKVVERLARKNDLEIDSFTDLRNEDLKTCDQLLRINTLKWRTLGAVEGASMGLLALVPVAGIPAAITVDILVIQVLSTAIASRIAYSYGYDADDPDERAFIQRLVHRSFVAQAAKVGPLRDVGRAAGAVKGRVRWSSKLRADHQLLVTIEKLMGQLGPKGAAVPVQSVAKVVPFIGVVIGAGTNSMILGNVAADAQRFCQTRFLCEKYELPMPAALMDTTEADPVDSDD